MRILSMAALAGFAMVAAACQSIPRDQTLGQYCADARRQFEDVCKINVEIAGTRTQLAATDLRVSEARAIAEQARIAADAANAREDRMFCETRTLRNTATGSCSQGYAVMSCTQTRYTTRSGGPSIMRSIDEQNCRFNSPVLEMKVRCCMAGAAPAPVAAVPLGTPQRRVRATPQSQAPRPIS
jgi:hypothetical protein